MGISVYGRSIGALCIAALLGLPACTGQEDGVRPQPREEIAVDLSEWTPIAQSRAVLFESGDDLLDPGRGGGNITLYAYENASAGTYIGGARVWWFKEAQRWVFIDGDKKLISYYWPNSEPLNVFAFMPDSRYVDPSRYPEYQTKETYVTPGPYTKDDGATFSCDLPDKVSNNPDSDPAAGFVANSGIQEFLCAYEKEQTKESNGGKVVLHFNHPFALVNFEVKTGSYRMKVDRIKFSCIHLKGKYATAKNEWTPDDGEAIVPPPDEDHPDAGLPSFTMEIDKQIPKEENYNSPLGAPFLVMPQKLDDVRLTLYATRGDGEKDVEKIEKTVRLLDPADPNYEWYEWKPGNQYTYQIKIGDNNEEIYFNVVVYEKGQKDWTTPIENDIDVE